MSSELLLRSGHVAVFLDRDASMLLLTCERHRADEALPLYWSDALALMRAFLDRHTDCQDASSSSEVADALLRDAVAGRDGT